MAHRTVLSATLLATVAVTALSIGYSQQPAQVLQQHVRPAVSSGQASKVGRMPPEQQLNLTIVLPLRNEAKLTELLGRLYDPASPDYRRFLSVGQFTAQFGPTAEEFDAVVQFVRRNGITVADTPANRLIVPIQGSVEQVERAFHVKMNLYRHPTENRIFYSPDREPSLDLNVPVEHIAGLNNFSIPHPLSKKADAAKASPDVTGSGPGGSYVASDMRAAYYGGSALTGAGQAVGLFELGGYLLSDLNATLNNSGLSNSVPVNNVFLDGLGLEPIDSADSEEVLDIAQAVGMAPGLSQVRVYIGITDADIFNKMATENIAKQLSVSWGWHPDDPATDDVFFKEFAAQGQTIFAASGDYGAFDATHPIYYPAEDAYVITVGGTHLATNGAGGSWASETAWNSYGDGSGGGISPDGIAIPSWQAGVANAANHGSATLRNVPDIAMEADLDNYVCAMGTCSESWGGTSFAAPRWAGFMALVNQQAAEAGTAPAGGLGMIASNLYALAEGSSYANAFHDITSGNDDTYGQQVWYSAVPGYDLVTGWGSADGQALIDALAGPPRAGFWLFASPKNLVVNQGSSGTASITVLEFGGVTSNVALSVRGLPAGVSAVFTPGATSGTSTLTLSADGSAPAGIYALSISGAYGGLIATTQLSLTVKATSTIELAVTSNGTQVASVSAGQVVTLTAQVSTGSVPIKAGQIKFCDATAALCEDIHLLGTTELTGAGTASLKFIPGIGGHIYKAIFVGATGAASSTSDAVPLTVTGQYPSTTTITQSGSPGDYNLTATVTGMQAFAPTGNVSFLDTSNGNALLQTAILKDQQTTLSFVNSQSPATASQPWSVAVGDFNGDGIPDLAVADSGIHTVTILLGKGDGTFSQTAESPNTNYCPVFIATGDFNGDGKTDLAVADSCQSSVTILLGNGDGTFTGTKTFPEPGGTPWSVAVGDFNLDGKEDLAVANSMSDIVTIFLGNGDGTFTPIPLSPGTGDCPGQVIVGDFNGDGKPDLAVANNCSNTVSILLGNGDGTFQEGPTAPTGLSPWFLAAGDFNGDGILDLAVANNNSNSVTVLIGKGDGTFKSPNSFSTGDQPYSVAVADVNRDGKPDLVVTNNESDKVTILLGNGDGTFTAANVSPATGTNPPSVAVSDFNGDGIPDLAVANWGSNTVTVLLSQLTQTATTTADGISIAGHGDHLVDADYTGDNTYRSSISGTVAIAAEPARPTITWNPPQPIQYGTALSTAQLNATCSVPGTFAYSPSIGTVLHAGSQVLTVTFTPSDSADYLTATASVTLTVKKVTPSVRWTTPPAITYGEVIGAAQLNATTSVGGKLAYSPEAGAMLDAGKHELSVTFAPSDPTDYSITTQTVSITVRKAILYVRAESTSKTYGSPLPRLEFEITGFVKKDTEASSITGAPKIITATSEKSAVGVYPIVVDLGTLKSNNYTFRFLDSELTVMKARLRVIANNFSIRQGAPIPRLTYLIEGFANDDTQSHSTSGEPQLTTAATSKSLPGKYLIKVSAGSLDAKNYNFEFVDGTLTVNKSD